MKIKNSTGSFISYNTASVPVFANNTTFQEIQPSYSEALLGALRGSLEKMALGLSPDSELDTASLLISKPIALGERLTVLKRLSQILGGMLMQPERMSPHFDRLLHLTTSVNLWLDKMPQTNPLVEEQEWEELQKCVILLTDWEDSLFQQSSLLLN